MRFFFIYNLIKLQLCEIMPQILEIQLQLQYNKVTIRIVAFTRNKITIGRKLAITFYLFTLRVEAFTCRIRQELSECGCIYPTCNFASFLQLYKTSQYCLLIQYFNIIDRIEVSILSLRRGFNRRNGFLGPFAFMFGFAINSEVFMCLLNLLKCISKLGYAC